jgi:hypothetical protein
VERSGPSAGPALASRRSAAPARKRPSPHPASSKRSDRRGRPGAYPARSGISVTTCALVNTWPSTATAGESSILEKTLNRLSSAMAPQGTWDRPGTDPPYPRSVAVSRAAGPPGAVALTDCTRAGRSRPSCRNRGGRGSLRGESGASRLLDVREEATLPAAAAARRAALSRPAARLPATFHRAFRAFIASRSAAPAARWPRRRRAGGAPGRGGEGEELAGGDGGGVAGLGLDGESVRHGLFPFRFGSGQVGGATGGPLGPARRPGQGHHRRPGGPARGARPGPAASPGGTGGAAGWSGVG